MQNSISQTLSPELRHEDHVEREIKDTVIATNKILVPHKFSPLLNSLLLECQKQVKVMLKDRSKNSSKYYPSLPCVVSKSLISKYQKNKKCKAVKKCVIPICGDKGRVVKLKDNKIRIPSLFKKEELPIQPLKPIVGNILSIELFRRKGTWQLSYTYNTPISAIQVSGFIGIDRNVRGNVATLADVSSGVVKRIGPDIKPWKDNLKNRRKKLQKKGSKGAKKTLVKINKKQSNRTRDINHKVSKKIVDYAVKHRKTIVLEDLGKIKDSKSVGNLFRKVTGPFSSLINLSSISLLCTVFRLSTSIREIQVRVVVDAVVSTLFLERNLNVVYVDTLITEIPTLPLILVVKVCCDQTSNERELLARPIDGPLTNQGLAYV